MTASTNQRCDTGPRRRLWAPQRIAGGPGLAVAKTAACALVVFCIGCGPFGYLKKVSVDASRAVGQAEKAGAAQYAPYEYWGAVTYLEQAKVLMAYSEYDRAFDYGDRAKQLADEAKKKAARREAGKMRESTEGTTQGAKPGAGTDAGKPVVAPAVGEAKGGLEVGGSVGGER